MVCALLSRLTASSVANFPDNMWAVIDFETCLRVTVVDLMLKISSSLAMARD
jgi:hypothetical protein